MALIILVLSIDSFPYSEPLEYWRFLSHDGYLLGYVTPEIAQRFQSGCHSDKFHVAEAERFVQIAESLASFKDRNRVFAEIALAWRLNDELLDKGWRSEHCTVAFSCLLGVVTYGVHINGYIPADRTKDKVMKMWISRRSATKAKYPGKLDNTIAGGLGYPYGLWENVVKECYEEGGLSAEFVEKKIVAAGAGHAQPEIEYVYDLAFDSETDNVPHPVDGEVEGFTLMRIDAIKQSILAGEFKPNCALVICDFMIRHGIMTAENEPNYLEILSRIHRRFPFALQQ
ncbi:hypothetical protein METBISCDRAFT_31077 [Metschnikowia bicuspidata]|uniref:Nudix hydrolase domain-containing protein n=1 Tax=Metschnikowia bicuspidata TaxID=27322 RepID=A0A4P9ZBK7_9ASCO|nr:hypothetical protein METBISCDRAFT_31077 [Metschnikowia bicuspidata]